MKLSVIIEKDEDGMYIGRVLQLKGCVSQGETKTELMKNIKDAIKLYLHSNDMKISSEFVEVRHIEVA
ncbi:MAG: type II toxin-antitoxin system HicB family antitoxin [Candidatus Woesearchaeota archaeon]